MRSGGRKKKNEREKRDRRWAGEIDKVGRQDRRWVVEIGAR